MKIPGYATVGRGAKPNQYRALGSLIVQQTWILIITSIDMNKKNLITRKQIEAEMIGHFGRSRFLYFKLIGVNAK